MADLRKVGIQVVAEGAPESTQAVANYDAALKGLDSTMQAVAQVAKLYGISGSEAARLVNEQAQQLGITTKQYADDLIIAAQDQQKLAEEGAKTFSQLTKAEQDALLATARDSKAYVEFWENAFTTVAQKEAEVATGTGGKTDPFLERLKALPQEYQDAAVKINASGVKAGTAIDAVTEAMKNGVSAAELNAEADAMLSEKMEQNAQAAQDQRNALDENTDSSKANAQAQQDLQDTAIKVGLAFFAMSIAARGLRDIGRELGIIYGQDVSRAFSKAADTLQTIGSFGSGGALIGSLFGPEGTIAGAGIGAGIGLLSSLPALLDKTTQGTLALVDAADKLAHKDDAVTTLSSLADITQKDAQAALDAAKNYQSEADAINNVAKAKQAQENAGKGGAFGAVDFLAQGDPTGIIKGLDFAMQGAKEDAQKLAEANLKVAESEFAITNAEVLRIQAADKLHDANAKLIDQFQTENQFLEQSTGLTKDSIDAIKTYTAAHLQSGEALANDLAALNELQTAQAKDVEHRSAYAAGIAEATDKVRKEADALNYEAVILPQHTKMIEDAAKAEEKYAQAIADGNQKLNDAASKERKSLADAQSSYNDAVESATRSRDDAVFNAEQNLTDRIASLWQNLENKIADVNQQLADKVSDINSKLADKLADIQSQLSDKIADIQTQLANKVLDIQTQLGDKIANIEQELSNRLAELAHSRQQTIDQDNQKILQAAKDLAEKLYQIERDRIEATNALDFNTAEQLRNAKTEHDRDAILRQHQFEQGQIDQKANDARHDAEVSYADKLAQLTKEKQAATDNYNYEVSLAKRLAAQKIADAERTAAEQLIVAQRTAEQQTALANRESQQAVATAQREAQQALAIAQREHDQALVQAERQYEQEKEAAVKAYNETVAAAAKAESQKLADAAKAFAERNKAIQASYDLEAKLIQRNAQLAYEAYIAQLKQIGEVALAYEMELKNLYENYTALGQKLFKSGLEDFTPLPKSLTTPPGGASGLDMDVPAGHVGDTFMVGARSGEHITISPPGYSSNTSNKSMNFYIYDATDPKKVGQVVASYIDGWSNR